MKRTFIPLMLCAAFGLLLVACGGSDSSNSTSNTTNTTTATSNSGGSSNTKTSTTTTSSSGEKIGIPECDEFIAKYETCINKVPEAQRAQYKSGLDQWRSTWRGLASNPQTKSTLAAICKTSLEQAKTNMKSYGCDF